jgi:uncharacterized membrane protein YqjE
MAIQPAPTSRDLALIEEASTADLVKEAFEEARELIRIEVELATVDVKDEIARVRRAAMVFAVALAASVLVLCLLAMALVLALGGTARVALAVAGGLLLVGGVLAGIGYALVPKVPLERTRTRLQTDVNQLKEHIA